MDDTMNIKSRKGEQGSARLKFLIVAVVITAVVYAGFQYVPVAYQAYQFKDLMQQKVDAAVALGHPPEWVQAQLLKSAPEYDVPPDAEIVPTKQNERMEVTVRFTRPVEFPGYTYEYTFDHTAISTDFIFK
jgi:hypothetical protein